MTGDFEIIPAVHPKKSTIYTYPKNIFISPNLIKPFTVKGFKENRLIATTHYCKKYGIMCCIVLKSFYICDVIERNRISISQKYSHEF